MIIRAASDDESDSEQELQRSRFGRAPDQPDAPVFDFGSAPVQQAAGATGARAAWVLATAGVVLLLLFDTAALVGGLAREDAALPTDAFGLAPVLLAALFPVEGDGWTIARALPACSANYWASLLLAAAWIYSREDAKAENLRAKGAVNRAWGWIAAIAVFGHVATCVYVLAALMESDGDRAKFWAGPRRRSSRTYPNV